MKILPATLIAMTAAWIAPVVLLAAGQLVTRGRTSDFAVTALWVGVFVALAWAVVVLPIMSRFGTKPVFADIRVSWLGWSLVGTCAFLLLLVPVIGRDALVILWYPALMGMIAGVVFALLRRKPRSTDA